jgi:GDP-D-mannose dehydratase
MFYDLPDPVQFATDIYNILEDDGIWTCEQSYMLTMIETNSIDTICHEHLEYYSIYNIKMIADLANFKIIDISFNKCNGGSFRIYFSKRDSEKYTEYKLTEMIDNEINYGIKTKDIYNTFMKNCEVEINKLKTFIINKNINIYGASTKGNCLLQYSNIGPEQIPYAVERNPRKYGKTTSTGIPIISEESMRENPPDYLLVLPWHFRDEIIEREDKFLQGGGKLIFPFPQFEIYSKKPKIMITGQNGMIGTYFRKEFDNYEYFFDYSIEFIPIIKPDIIIHLAGISNSQYAKENCLESIKTNGMMACEICDIIYKNGLKTKFFNASSSEIFKGHINYTITDNDNNFKHLHPYSIGKILSHTTVDWYRKMYNLPFSNGIIFTTESPLKKPTFLLNKVAKHIHSWKKDSLPLCLGNLDSYRNIIHVSDVINAINLIVSQEQGNNYVICGKESEKVLYLVLRMYYLAGMEVSEKPNGFYSNGKLVFYIDGSFNEEVPTNINGVSDNLTKLGWEQRKNIDFILEELVK